ncbi:MAG: cell division protein ZipA [Pseudomonadota bacterium]
MDSLRIILVLSGIALVVAIYLWDRIRSRKRNELGRWQDMEIEESEAGHIDPLISNDNPFDDEWKGEAIKAQRDSGAMDDNLEGLKNIVALSSEGIVDDGAEQPKPDEAVIILSLMAKEGSTFNGMQLLDAMELCGLSHGDMGIFHYTELESGQPLFSVANVLEPGSFDRDNLGDLETPGLALFMRLPAPIDGVKALLTFVQQAKRLKEQLSGSLTDGQRRELTRETLEDLKSTARRFRVSTE